MDQLGLDPITLGILGVFAVIVMVAIVWTWEIFGMFIKIITAFAVLGLIIGFVNSPVETEQKIGAAVHHTIDFAHGIRDQLFNR